MTTSIDGLISGMNTSQVISQLMQVEAQQQTGLKQKVQDQKTVIQSLQSVNSKVSALKTAADKLILPMTWQAAKAASTSDAVTATAKTGAPTGSWTFNVNALATAQSSTAVVPSSGSIMTDPAAGVQITIGGVANQIDVTEVVRDCPWQVETMSVGELLRSQRRWGRTRVRKFLTSLALNENRELGRLTDRQRNVLAAELTAKTVRRR